MGYGRLPAGDRTRPRNQGGAIPSGILVPDVSTFRATPACLALLLLAPAPAQGPDGLVIERGRLNTGLEPALTVRLVDLDRNGLTDLVRLREQGIDLLRQAPGGTFARFALGPFGLPVGVTNRDIEFGRLDPSGDLFPDAVVLASDGSVELLVNNGNGGLARVQPSPIAPQPRAAGNQVLVGDLDRDGRDDVVVLLDSLPPAVFLARGAGFMDVTATNVPATLAVPRSRGVLVDVDGDGDLDLVLASSGGMQPVLLANNGAGVFSLRPNAMPAVPVSAARILAADVVGSPLPDLVLGGAGNVTRPVAVFANNGGVFAAAPSLGFAAAGVRDLALADADHDGIPDLVVLQNDDGEVVFGPGGGGGFRPAVRLLPPGSRTALAAADLEGDGDLDLVLAGAGFEDQILLRGPSGWFDTEATGFPILGLRAPLPGVLVDFDGNLDPDWLGYLQDGTPLAFRNDGTARFTAAPGVLPALGNATSWRSVQAMSLAGPGRRDLIVLGSANASVPQPVRVLVHNGAGYVDGTALRWLGAAQPVAAVAPLRSGISTASVLDDVVVATFGGELLLMRNQGGTLVPASGFPGALGLFNLSRLLVADLDGDGRQDLVALQGNAPPRVLLARPGPAFVEHVGPTLNVGQAGDGAVGDVTGDGVPDLVLLPAGQPGLVVLRGDGGGGFVDISNSVLPPLGPATFTCVAVARMDGAPRILLGRDGGPQWMLTRGQVTGAFGALTPLPFRGSTRAVSLLPADLDLDGDLDLLVHRSDSPPQVLIGDGLHLSQRGPGQIGRSLTIRMVSPAAGAFGALLFGAPVPAAPSPYGMVRLALPATTVWTGIFGPGQREHVMSLALPPALLPGRLPLQAGFLDLGSFDVRLSNLELFDVLDH